MSLQQFIFPLQQSPSSNFPSAKNPIKKPAFIQKPPFIQKASLHPKASFHPKKPYFLIQGVFYTQW
jgi:hypothetical protein